MLSLKYGPYYQTYINLVNSDNAKKELEESGAELEALLNDLQTEELSLRYAPEKWSIAEVLHHLIETELIFNARALRIAKEEKLDPIPGFDENSYAAQSQLDGFGIQDLRDYFQAVRTSTVYLFHSLHPEQLKKVGVASGNEIEVQALFFINAGHTRHHLKVIKERYLTRD